jgi:hypothetical protein
MLRQILMKTNGGKVLAAGLLLLLVSIAVRAEPFETIINNGSSDNRVDLAVLGDGYTAAELQKYMNDVQSFLQGFFAQEPFREYQRYLNVHRIDVTSIQSGADHPERSPAVFVNTALDATYNCGGIVRLICVNVTTVNNIVANTLGADQHDMVLVIVNDSQYGGSGGSVAVASTNAAVVELVLHEEGHSFGFLADEYGGPPPPSCNSSVEPFEPNATRETQRAQIKWNQWIDPVTPVPTTSTTPGVPGLYQGAKYCDTGLYRPTFSSKMRALGFPYEQINVEQLVKRIHNFASPFDSATPAPGGVMLTQGQTQAFSVSTPVPFTHNLTITWTVDNQQQGTGPTFDLNSTALSVGDHEVGVFISDPTAMVRSDPFQALKTQRFWDVTVNAGVPPALQFSATNYDVGEAGSSAIVTVNRTGDTSGTSSVDFASSNGTASQLRDYEVASGMLTFIAGQTSRTFRVLIVDDVFPEGNETVNLTLSNPTNGSLVAPVTATVTIVDNDSAGTTSPVAKQFVANMTPGQVVPPANSNGIGGGVVLLSQDETTAKVSLIYSQLSGSPFLASIRGPAGPDVNGPIVFHLSSGSPVTDLPISPSAQQVSDLRAGLHFMNVHSSGFGNGEIRGQLYWNPAEEADFFVRQAYFDFLSREPDAGGFTFWTNEITQCQSDVECLRRKRVDVSNAFFYEQEFQQTAAYVLRLYRAAYGNNQPFPNPNPSGMFPNEEKKLPSYAVFVADRARVIGGANLAQKQVDLANLFVQRPEFTTKYPASLATADQFVDAVLLTLQDDLAVNLSGQRASLINQYNTQGGRGAVMYRLADDNVANPISNQPFINAEYNRSFVLGQYFGYLRRNPDIPGFVFWLGQVNGAPLRDVPKQHAMVCSFITSGEYQFRFGPIASRNNNECPQ